MPKSKLPPKIKAFVTEYLKEPNGTRAAIKAGYSPKSANSQASRFLRRPDVRKELEKLERKTEEKALVDVAYVLANLKEVAERCMTHIAVMEFDHEEKRMIQKTEFEPETGKLVGVYEFDSAGANRSLELLGKHLKMFTDKIEIDVAEGVFERLERARLRASEIKKG